MCCNAVDSNVDFKYAQIESLENKIKKQKIPHCRNSSQI